MKLRTKIAAGVVLITALGSIALPAIAAGKAGKSKPVSLSHHMGARDMHRSPLASLVKAGTLTQAKADIVETATRTAMEAAMTANFNAGLTALVADSTITQVQADAAKADAGGMTRGEHHANLSTWTAAQRTALFTWLQAHPVDRAAIGKAAVAKLVTDGMLTQAQADAVNAAFAAMPAGGHGSGRGMGGSGMGHGDCDGQGPGERRGHGGMMGGFGPAPAPSASTTSA